MNIIERGRAFVQWVKRLWSRSEWDWRRCPHCGSTWTIKNGSYRRRPWTLEGRREVHVPRHLCRECGQSYSEGSPRWVRGSWYAREVHRYAVDHGQHVGSSLRRTAEELRSWIGHQERWWMWHVEEGEGREGCHLCASTVGRWVVWAGEEAEQWAGVGNSGQFGVDGLWARLRAGAKRVVLLLVDTVAGVIWATLVAVGEERAESWKRLFQRVKEAGLSWRDLNGLVSDGSQGLLSYLREALGSPSTLCLAFLAYSGRGDRQGGGGEGGGGARAGA